jgi:hypothetical protein
MALNPSGIMSIGGPSTGSSINLELGLSATANSNMNQADFRTLAGIPSGVISLSNFYGKSNVQFTVRGVFFGGTAPGTNVSRNTSNIVTNTGVIGADTANASATSRSNIGQGHTYGGDKAMFFSGNGSGSTTLGSQVLFSNTGVFAAQNASPSIARMWGAMCGYGTTGTAIAFWGSTGTSNNTVTAQQNLISNTGVVAASTATAAGAARHRTIATNYSADRSVGIAGFGQTSTTTPTVSNLVSNTGVIAADVTVPSTTLKTGLAATRYGTTGQSYFCGGRTSPGNVSLNTYNPISNTGTVSGDSTYTGTARYNASCAPFASDGQAMFAWGSNPDNNTYNLISNTGVFGGTTSMAGGQAVRTANAGAGVSYT